MKGSQRVGFEWSYTSTEYNIVSKAGEINFELNFYSKQDINLKPVFRLNRLYENQMTFDLSEFSMKVATALKFHRYKNMLCLDLYSSIDDFTLLVDVTQKFIECSKDIVMMNKPNWLDQCQLSQTATVQVRKYEPLANDQTKTIYFVGSGNYDDGCFPGNIFMYLIDADMWLRAKWLLGQGYGEPVRKEDHPLYRYYKTLEQTGEQDEQALIDVEAQYRFLKKNVMPYIEMFIIKIIEGLGGVAQENLAANSDDGTHVIYDKTY